MEEPVAPPKVTVLVLSHNRAESLRRCLTSLEASQGRDQFEIIVVDNGSLDESPQLDPEFPGATFMRLPHNFGATKALNIGMRTAAGEYIFFLSTEATVQPNTVAALLARMEADAAIGGVCPLIVDAEGVPIPFARRLPTLGELSLLWRDPDALPLPDIDTSADSVPVEYPGRDAWMVRKAFVKAMNWLDERYGQFGADVELAYHLWRSQRKILVIPSIRVTMTPAPLPSGRNAVKAALASDRVHGAALYARKHADWFTGFKLRLGAVFHVVGRLLSFQDPGFQMSRLSAILSDRKIDGTRQDLDW